MFNNGILLNGVLIPKLLNNASASCSFINLDFLLPQTTHFEFLPFLHLYSLYFFGTLNNMSACLFYNITDSFFCFCFINLDLSDKQTPHFELFLITLFVIVVFHEPTLLVCFLQAKQ